MPPAQGFGHPTSVCHRPNGRRRGTENRPPYPPGIQATHQGQTALDAASGPAPTGLIIRNPDGEPARVSWLEANGNLTHRPFDGAFPPNYPAELAIRQCTEILYWLLGYMRELAPAALASQ